MKATFVVLRSLLYRHMYVLNDKVSGLSYAT